MPRIAFNRHGVWAIYQFEIARSLRTLVQSLVTPVITTSLYFVVFGAAIGSRLSTAGGVSYGAFIVPGLIMLALFTESLSNASFGIYFPKFTGTIYELLSAPVSYVEIVIAYVGAASTKSVVLGLTILITASLFVPIKILHPFWMIAFLLLTAFTFSLFGFIIGIWAKGFEQLQFIPMLIITPLTFLGGAFYSCERRHQHGHDRGISGNLLRHSCLGVQNGIPAEKLAQRRWRTRHMNQNDGANQNSRDGKFLGVLVLLCGAFLAASAIGSFANAAPAVTAAPVVTAPPRLDIDLNAFDASKKLMALPNGESLAYIDRGERSGPAVVLIHGYTDNARDWVPMLPYLSKHYRLILVDIRGHGRSSKPECCYTRLDFAYDIKLLLDALGVQKADIVGHSLGSIIAQTFAEYWPERTAHVVLVSSTGGAPPKPTRLS